MEKTFNKIVLSSKEPNVEDLWLRCTLEKTKEGKFIHGLSLHWFSPGGWKKLFDFDTRYNVSTDYLFADSYVPYKSETEYKPEIGIVDVDNTYYLYDASRELANNANFVTEKGLKYHVDNLQKQINKLREDLNTEIKDRINGDNSLSERIDSLSNRISSLNSSLNSINASINSIEGRLNSLESQL